MDRDVGVASHPIGRACGGFDGWLVSGADVRAGNDPDIRAETGGHPYRVLGNHGLHDADLGQLFSGHIGAAHSRGLTMENATYAGLTRQMGLLAEMQAIANNIANASTTGFRAEEVVFAEHISALGADHPSLSMASAEVRNTVFSQGSLTQTGGPYDLAIEGEGFFLVQTPDGVRLTRAGHFTPNEAGDLVTSEGYPVLDAGGAPVFVPTGAGPVAIAADGTVSAGGQPVAQIGLVEPLNPLGLVRENGVRFRADDGFEPSLTGRMVQGFLEHSNVNPILQIGRMIEVQRAYELGQSFMEQEDERIRTAIRQMHRT